MSTSEPLSMGVPVSTHTGAVARMCLANSGTTLSHAASQCCDSPLRVSMLSCCARCKWSAGRRHRMRCRPVVRCASSRLYSVPSSTTTRVHDSRPSASIVSRALAVLEAPATTTTSGPPRLRNPLIADRTSTSCDCILSERLSVVTLYTTVRTHAGLKRAPTSLQ